MAVLWAWRQAQLEQSADEQGTSPRQRRQPVRQDQPRDSLAQNEAVDGPKPGDQGHLAQLQARLRATVTSVHAVVEHLASVPEPERTVLHAAVAADRAAAERGFAWLLERFDQPSAVVPVFAQLGPALNALMGTRGRQLDLFGEDVVAAVRDVAGDRFQDEDVATWRDGWRFVSGWLREGMTLQQGEPPFWTATVLAHDRRRDDVAVLQLGTDLPYPAESGQRVLIEHPLVPAQWRRCWISAPPQGNRLELHVQAAPGDDTTGALVHGTRVGDPVRLRRAEGHFHILPHRRAVLVVAEDVHVAPVKAVLDELAEDGDERVIHVFWGVSTRDDLYDLESLRAHAGRCAHATVHAVVARGPAHPYLSGSLPQVVVDFAEWTSHDVYLCGSPLAVGVIRNMLVEHRVPADRIRSVTLDPLGSATPT